MDPQIISPKKKGIALIIIGFIAAILACAMFWSLKDAPIPSNDLAPITSTSDWQTYRNEEYGFEFKYPVFMQPTETVRNNDTHMIGLDTFILTRDFLNGRKIDLVNLTGYWVFYFPDCPNFLDQLALKTNPQGINFFHGSGDGVSFLLNNSGKNSCFSIQTIYDVPDRYSKVLADKELWNKTQQILTQILSTFKFFEPVTSEGDLKYKKVELKDVINYADTAVNNYVETSGIVAGAQLTPYHSFLLKDGNENYLLIALSKFEDIKFGEFISKLELGDKVTVKGIAGFTEPALIQLEEKFNLNTKLPKQIGMLILESTIKISDTSNWDTYQDEEYGFKFRYPKDWKLMTYKWDNSGYVSLYSPDTNIIEIGDTDSPSNAFLVYFDNKRKGGLGFVDSGWGASELGGGFFRQININDLFEIKIMSLDKHNFEILNQIYSTFKFLP